MTTEITVSFDQGFDYGGSSQLRLADSSRSLRPSSTHPSPFNRGCLRKASP